MLVARPSSAMSSHLTRGRGPAGRMPTAMPALAMVPTAWGVSGIVWKNHEDERCEDFQEKPDDALLCRIYTPGLTPALLRQAVRQTYADCREVFADEHGRFHAEIVPEWFHDLARYLRDYYSASLRGWTHPQFVDNWAFWRPRLDWSPVTAFQRRVLEVVAAIPSGSNMTYGEVARSIGKPAASRAVGAAIGSNPWPVLVPCHRVIGSSGKLTGFSAPGGIETKRRMLALEAG
jgi:O-6-methylguanine DNA methyltransferase